MKHPTSFLNGMLKVSLHTTKLTDKLVKKKKQPENYFTENCRAKLMPTLLFIMTLTFL